MTKATGKTDGEAFTDITVLLDRSGSMAAMRDDAIGGFNAFIAEQKKLPGSALITLVQFDDRYEVVYAGRDIREVPDLTRETFVPRGGTLLRDSLVRTLSETLARVSERRVPVLGEDKLVKAEHPVLFVVITDGADTGSATTGEAVKRAVDEAKGRGWEVLLIGANIDAISLGASLGAKGLNYQQGNMKQAMGAASAYVGTSRLAHSPDAGIRARASVLRSHVMSARSVESHEMHESVASYADLIAAVETAVKVETTEE